VRDRAREDVGDLTSLKASLSAVGQLQPIAAEPDGTLLFGERRLQAMRELGETEIAVSVIADLSDLQRLLVERDENTERKEMSPAEKTRMFDRIEAVKKRLTPKGPRPGVSENFSSTPPGSEKGKSRDKAARAAGISHASAAKVREVRETAKDESQPPEVREEAQRQYEELKQPGAKVDRAHKAVKQAKAKAERKSTLATGLGPGQWLKPNDPKPEVTLTRRLTDGINKGQHLAKLAAEITDQDLDLDVATIYALRNRMTDEIKVRTVMKDALNQQIEKRGYNKRKATPDG
jgi:hypothetical protein